MNGLELQDILLTFPEGGRRRTVLDIPYLKVTSGEHIGIRGASGSGKSSLLNVVSGLVLPDRGTVRWGATVPRQIVLGIWASGISWDLGGTGGTGS